MHILGVVFSMYQGVLIKEVSLFQGFSLYTSLHCS